jgi:hypothetical protein
MGSMFTDVCCRTASNTDSVLREQVLRELVVQHSLVYRNMQYRNSGYQNSFIQDSLVQGQDSSYRIGRNSSYRNSFLLEQLLTGIVAIVTTCAGKISCGKLRSCERPLCPIGRVPRCCRPDYDVAVRLLSRRPNTLLTLARALANKAVVV